MEYREIPAPPAIAHLVSATWTLEVGEAAEGWATHVATPDGCVEIIRRLDGRSIWRGEQPSRFVAGIITGPAELRLSSASRFVGLRLRPWAWNALSGTKAREFVDDWRDLGSAAPAIDLPDTAEAALTLVPPGLLDAAGSALAQAILASRSMAELAARSGRPPRWLQRWFAREVGLPPRTYLRLVRFNETFAELGQLDGTLADHAAAHGFADQAHMAREFRRMSGQAAVKARKQARGPFL